MIKNPEERASIEDILRQPMVIEQAQKLKISTGIATQTSRYEGYRSEKRIKESVSPKRSMQSSPSKRQASKNIKANLDIYKQKI